MSRNHKKIGTTLNYIEHFLILAYAVTACNPILAFALLLGIPMGIPIRIKVGLKSCTIAAVIKKYKSKIKKKKKKHDKIILLVKSKLSCIKFLISKALMNQIIR